MINLKSIIIKNKKWKIRLKSRIVFEGYECNGLCTFKKRTIDIKKGLTDSKYTSVLIHELVHAIIFEYGLDDAMEISLEEVLCDAIESEFMKLFDIRIN